jgi:hypothetical protein
LIAGGRSKGAEGIFYQEMIPGFDGFGGGKEGSRVRRSGKAPVKPRNYRMQKTG